MLPKGLQAFSPAIYQGDVGSSVSLSAHTPPLTTVEMPKYRMGTLAMEMLVQKRQHPEVSLGSFTLTECHPPSQKAHEKRPLQTKRPRCGQQELELSA
jgi:hypothetical protein